MAKTKIHGEYLDASVISGQTQVTAVGADSVLIFDATDNALKKALLSDVIETVADGDISTAKLADNAVTSAKIDTNIAIAGDLTVQGGQINTGNTSGDHSEFGTDGSGHTFIDASTSGGNLFLQAGGSTKVTMNSTGFVGIGTTTLNKVFNIADPAQGGETLKLHFEANSSADNWEIYGYDRTNSHYTNMSLGNSAVFIATDTKVGIGTTSPTAPLHIKTSIDDAYSLRIEGATNNSANYHGIGFAGESSNTKAAILFKDIAVSYARGDMLFCLNNDADQTSATDSDAVMTLLNGGNMKLHGGETAGVQEIIFNNSQTTVNDGSTFTLANIINTGALIAIGANRSNLGVTYDHCLLFAETGTAFTTLSDPSGRFAINSATTDGKVNVFVNSDSVVIQNEVGSAVGITAHVFRFQGN
jgi:hypothetical protein